MLNFCVPTGLGLVNLYHGIYKQKKKKPIISEDKGDDILSHITAVPSAQINYSVRDGKGEPTAITTLRGYNCFGQLSIIN
jgi:hypothetical protein